MVSRLRLALLAAIPALKGTTRTCNVYLLLDDCLDGLLHSIKILLLARKFIHLQQTLIARHHLISLMTILARPPNLRVRETTGYRLIGSIQQLRAFGRIQLLGDIICKLQIALVVGTLVEIDNRLQYRATRHTEIVTRHSDCRCLRAYLRHQVVDNTTRSLQCSLIARQIVPRQQTERRVLSTPNIPLLELIFGGIVTDVAI